MQTHIYILINLWSDILPLNGIFMLIRTLGLHFQ